MARLTRAESQARTRERLVATARELFLRDGYSATSLARVAEEAGFSTGAVYSNFHGKSELALVVLDRIHAEQLGRVGEIFTGPGTLDDKLDTFEKWADEAMTGGWPRLELEFALEARQDPALVGALAERERAAVDVITAGLDRQLADLGLGGVVSARSLAAAVVSLSVGMAIQRMIDPKVSVGGIVGLVRSVLTFAHQRGGTR
ncbi:DNA-binding transcriptional regulator, AcrR family [Amycolatopsis arida]|uniref:DNA-binding transcriptional regulator, AcrR family n=1 Tax=Amycolatopsis arida TaxID=587909 RepID=A0A1I5Q5W2_9PSEU|nr:TetR/AcrR family transcriptional regulator [Amycolatopsis arida]TDX98721.1 AcrR family transcriptional regulator [Amycolatopsis arida]SFP41351.1 DNA-binding transcriptional regulator, AcrR family [Amycolatopsis arida]